MHSTQCICHCIPFASTPCLYCIFYSLNFQRFRRWKYFALFISQTFLLYIFYFQFIIKGIYRLINHTNLIFTFCIFIAQHTMNISDNTQYLSIPGCGKCILFKIVHYVNNFTVFPFRPVISKYLNYVTAYHYYPFLPIFIFNRLDIHRLSYPFISFIKVQLENKSLYESKHFLPALPACFMRIQIGCVYLFLYSSLIRRNRKTPRKGAFSF